MFVFWVWLVSLNTATINSIHFSCRDDFVYLHNFHYVHLPHFLCPSICLSILLVKKNVNFMLVPKFKKNLFFLRVYKIGQESVAWRAHSVGCQQTRECQRLLLSHVEVELAAPKLHDSMFQGLWEDVSDTQWHLWCSICDICSLQMYASHANCIKTWPGLSLCHSPKLNTLVTEARRIGFRVTDSYPSGGV